MTADEDVDFEFVAAIAAARSGEAQGFDQLHERFAREIYLLGVFECHSKPELLVDQVLSQAFGSVTSFVGSEAAYAGHLFELALENIVDERASLGLEIDEHIRCGKEGFEERMMSAEAVELHDALHWLSFEERQMLHLRLTFGQNLLQAARTANLTIPEARAVQASVEQTLNESSQAANSAITLDSAKVSISS